MTELDISNAEDLLVIAANILTEIKVYDGTVLNPYNFTAICMLEHGLPYNPESLRIKASLLKLYSKLGCSKTVASICQKIQLKSEKDKNIFKRTEDYEKLGAI